MAEGLELRDGDRHVPTRAEGDRVRCSCGWGGSRGYPRADWDRHAGNPRSQAATEAWKRRRERDA